MALKLMREKYLRASVHQNEIKTAKKSRLCHFPNELVMPKRKKKAFNDLFENVSSVRYKILSNWNNQNRRIEI